MPAKDLGVKHSCWKCGTKFYDLRKPAPTCPKCGSDPRAAPKVKAPPAAERRRVKEEPEVEDVADSVEASDLDDSPDEPEEPEETKDDA